jgi:adenylate kinase
MKKVVMFYGPPGAGKGTQANLLANKFGFVHFDTGKYLEQVVHDPANQSDPEIKKMREVFDSGTLVDPAFVLKITSEKTKKIADANFNLVFSGSPRTMFEAFGDDNNKGLINLLTEEYGKENVMAVFLNIDPKISIIRNGNRMICSVCGTAILYSDAAHKHKTCPLCGGELKKRTVDNPKVFETRIKEYEERTLPIIAALKEKGYEITNVDAEPLPYEVHEKVIEKLNLK